MQAKPTDSAGKKALAEEIKNRAKGALGTRNFPEASALYGKAIEVMTTEETEQPYRSILHANRSMCHLGMNKFEEAATDAAKSIELDPEYVKGHYRHGMALVKLLRWEEARDAFQKGCDMKPDDKEMRAQLDKVLFSIANPSSTPRPKPQVAKKSVTAPAPAPKPATTGPATKPKAAMPSAALAELTAASSSSGDGDSTKYRGYKLTSDGRKTTFFNNELTEEAKALIGDITPKAIAAPVEATTDATKGSAWNQAGTFESTDLSKWARPRLIERLKSVRASVAGGVQLSVTSATIEGDGEVVAARGKRKHIYDFTAELEWAALWAESMVTVKGKLKVLDIEADEAGDYDFTGFSISGTGKPSPENAAVVNTHVRAGGALQQALSAEMNAFRAEFKAK